MNFLPQKRGAYLRGGGDLLVDLRYLAFLGGTIILAMMIYNVLHHL